MASDHHAAHPWPATTPKANGNREGRNDGAQPSRAERQRTSLPDRLWKALVWGAMGFFLLNVVLLIATVAVNSVATRWFGTLLPQGFTLHWYAGMERLP